MQFESDPFFAECRAYGRIRNLEAMLAKTSKAKKPPKIAVSCHGFLALPSNQYREIFRERFGILDWNETDAARGTRSRAPFRALVKDLVPGNRAVFDPRKMLRDLKIMQSHGVIHRDIHPRNFLNGLSVDFSRTWTRPHWCFEVLDQSKVNAAVREDCHDWNAMVIAECPNSRSRAIRNEELRDRLRRRSSGSLPAPRLHK